MNQAQVEKKLSELVRNINKEDFIYDFLMCYGIPKATITLMKKGSRDLSKVEHQKILKKKIFFHEELNGGSLYEAIDKLKNDSSTFKHDPNFIIVTDYKNIVAIDVKANDTLDSEIENLHKKYDFFLPLAGMKKYNVADENEADVKAAERMAKLYDQLQSDNEFETEQEIHHLNIFLSRLLFCFFAEDTDMFEGGDNIFTNSIKSHTQEDGSDLNVYLDRLFEALNTTSRDDYPDHFSNFDYVNGGLFAENIKAPQFTRKSKRLIEDLGELDWSEINPDIFGSMIQAVITPEHRGGLGMHYTSVPNIMKVIEPLFLDELKEEFKKNHNNEKKLNKLLLRLEKIKIFDPACGSGNFLIIAYKELRELEINIFVRINELSQSRQLPLSRIKLSQFYGIELDDFAHEIAILSLWLSEHQMNKLFKEKFGDAPNLLPLKPSGNIVHGNATRIDWEEVCPKEKDDEIYILGNPPYLGSSMQDATQKEDMAIVFDGFKNYKNLDYIACWFYKGAEYISGINSKYAFVSTNSICQGEQVGLLWPTIFDKNIEINFAYTSFKWSNSAKSKAKVICVIVGLANKQELSKKIFNEISISEVKSITPYLTSGRYVKLERRSKNISPSLQSMVWGNKATDGGNFILTIDEVNSLKNDFPDSVKFIKKYIGSVEFIRGVARWCLWIRDKDLDKAKEIPFIFDRIERVKNERLLSKAASTRASANKAHKFIQIQGEPDKALIIPSVSSINRDYIPIGFVESDTVVNAQCYVVYRPEFYLFGVLSSKMHITWVRAVAGKLKNDFRYSSALCYSSFPVPELTDAQKKIIEDCALNVLDERDRHPTKTMAELYDPDKMPDGLRQAHKMLDEAVEKCYRKKPFESDEERLEHLFNLYEKMTSEEV